MTAETEYIVKWSWARGGKRPPGRWQRFHIAVLHVRAGATPYHIRPIGGVLEIIRLWRKVSAQEFSPMDAKPSSPAGAALRAAIQLAGDLAGIPPHRVRIVEARTFHPSPH